MDKLQKKVLESLLTSYEKSKTFRGENQVNQSFSVSIGKLFPRYYDDAEYDYFCQVNEAMEELCAASLVIPEYERKGILKKVRLNPERLKECYELLGRMPRKQEQEQLAQIWEEVEARWQTEKAEPLNVETDIYLTPLIKYIREQRLRVEKNQNVEYYHHDLEEYRELIFAVKAVLRNKEEVFIRNFSIQLFHDSKRMEQLANQIGALLYQYGEFQEKESVLEECGIVHTPTYVMMKGNGRVRLGGQEIDLSLLQGDIALSTESVKSLEDARVLGSRVVTVENLTSFHDYPCREDFVIYLGGFHNKVKREFLLYLYERNARKEYRHFGDIDAGGFCILEHLKRKTGIPFRSFHMDTEMLQKYQRDTKPLTENDRKRLMQLREELSERIRMNQKNEVEDYREVIDYMLRADCKLEQEAISISEILTNPVRQSLHTQIGVTKI